MTDTEDTDQLGTLFVSVTGTDSVVERQHGDAPGREIRAETADDALDAASYHGLDDAIDEPELAASGP